jgi:outer membrane receptor protein involved in Fe transport
MRMRLIAGADFDWSPGTHFEKQITPARVGGIFESYTDGATIYDYDVTFLTASPYGQGRAENTVCAESGEGGQPGSGNPARHAQRAVVRRRGLHDDEDRRHPHADQMDADNTHRYPGHDLFGLRLSVPVYSRTTLFARLRNVTDERYAESSAYTAARGEEFAPGLPRAFYLGVEVR